MAKLTDEYEMTDVTAQEMALHVAMCVNAEYIQSWGTEEFLTKLLEYVPDEQNQLAIIKVLCQGSISEPKEKTDG